MNKNEAIEYIHSVSWRGSKPGLERINALCAALGNPQEKLKFVHVAGTNGKGSVCAFLSSILTCTGFKTGRFTSPYITHFNDRICIDGTPISDNELAKLVEKVKPIAESMEDKPTEFELITAIGFLYFLEQKCDIVVLEVGLGGKKDSTNVIMQPLLSIITSIDLDHTQLLGNTLAAVACEKAGIIKENCPVLAGKMENEALERIKREAIKKSCSFDYVDAHEAKVLSQTFEGTVFDYNEFKNVNIKMLGNYQVNNACLAIRATELLNIDKSAIISGLSKAKWPARFELLSKNPIVIYDGGHNRQGIEACKQSYKRYFDKKAIVISGVMQDKEIDVIADNISEIADNVIALAPDNPRALAPCEYALLFKARGVACKIAQSEEEAAQKAIAIAREKDLPVLCTGSLYAYEKLSRAIADVLAKN